MPDKQFNKRILFIGIPDMAYIGLDTLYYAGVNIVGVIGPYKSHNTYPYFKNFVLQHRLNFIEYDTINSKELHNTIKSLNVDLGVICSYNNKIPKEFIDCTKDGIINLHPSLLPDYRGGNPYSRVIINGETETGVTIHMLSEEFDTGNIVLQRKCPITKNETMGTIFNKTNIMGCKMLLEVLTNYEKTGKLDSIPQREGTFKSAKNISNQESFIDFNKTADEIERFVRGLNPYLSALTMHNGQMLKVFKVEAIDEDGPNQFRNGQIYKVTDKDAYIKTKKDSILIKIMQYGGLFTGDSEDFINIVHPQIGDKLGN